MPEENEEDCWRCFSFASQEDNAPTRPGEKEVKLVTSILAVTALECHFVIRRHDISSRSCHVVTDVSRRGSFQWGFSPCKDKCKLRCQLLFNYDRTFKCNIGNDDSQRLLLGELQTLGETCCHDKDPGGNRITREERIDKPSFRPNKWIFRARNKLNYRDWFWSDSRRLSLSLFERIAKPQSPARFRSQFLFVKFHVPCSSCSATRLPTAVIVIMTLISPHISQPTVLIRARLSRRSFLRNSPRISFSEIFLDRLTFRMNDMCSQMISRAKPLNLIWWVDSYQEVLSRETGHSFFRCRIYFVCYREVNFAFWPRFNFQCQTYNTR